MFKGFTTITGDLIICRSDITGTAGLEKLTSVGGDLSITDNTLLTDLSGLENLTSISGDLSISWNNALTYLGMTGLQKVGSDFTIFVNPMLCNSLAEELMNQVIAGGGIGGEANISGNNECMAP